MFIMIVGNCVLQGIPISNTRDISSHKCSLWHLPGNLCKPSIALLIHFSVSMAFSQFWEHLLQTSFSNLLNCGQRSWKGQFCIVARRFCVNADLMVSYHHRHVFTLKTGSRFRWLYLSAISVSHCLSVSLWGHISRIKLQTQEHRESGKEKLLTSIKPWLSTIAERRSAWTNTVVFGCQILTLWTSVFVFACNDYTWGPQFCKIDWW